MDSSLYALEDFAVGELVLVKNVNRKEPWWPAIVLDPIKEAPETVRRQMQPERLCVMFYGPPANKKRPRDFCWAKEGDILPLIEHLEHLQSLYTGRKERGSAVFQAAIEEILLVERGFKDPILGASEDTLEGQEGASFIPGCISCGITLNQKELEHTEQYAGRCGNCQQLYEQKMYCPVCDKVWMQTDKNMVGCDICDFWVHTHCDPKAAEVLKANSEDIKYHCPTCREKKSTKHRLAELRKAEDDVRKAQPRKPRSAYSLFAAEIHKQYSVDNGMRIDFKDMSKIVGETWRTLTSKERAPYEKQAKAETLQYEEERKVFEKKHKIWADLQRKAKASGLLPSDNGGGGVPLLSPPPNPNPAPPALPQPDHDKVAISSKPAAHAKPDPSQKVIVICNGYRGQFLVGQQRVICMCSDCRKKPEGDREFSCTQYEQHCGAGAAKKWKASLRVEPGCVPEVPEGAHPMQVGKWLDNQGIDAKPCVRASAAPALPAVPTQKAIEKLLAAVYAPWNDIDNGKHKPVKVRWAGDRCTVCDSDVDYDMDQLVSCDMCGITVHQSCYGVAEVPGEDDMWLCRACELKDDSKPPQCCLCPIEGGALKPTTEAGLWCHATCMHWIPEVSAVDDRRMEPVTGIKSIQKERWELNCCICKQRIGAKIQCSSCYTAYHPLCARIAGLYMNMVDTSDGQEEGTLRLISYCPKHCTPHPETAGIQVVKHSQQEAEAEDDTNGLWNGQPFKPLPAVDVPDLPSGCARAMSLQGWERGSHGTGMGHTTNKGFWIPEKPANPPPEEMPALPEAPRAGGRGAHSRPSKRHPRLPAGPKVPRGGGRLPKEIKQETDHESQQEDEAPEAVQLMPLPEGVPEVLDVTCNGRSGKLLVRTQRVLHCDAEISASKFEQVCGKGDAKKWKSSIWTEDADGQQDVMMQEWLGQHKLDRKALAALASNAQAVQAYEDYLRNQVQDIMEDLLAEFDEPAPAPDMSVEEEDKPEQQLAKLAEVAEAAPIKHEHHSTPAADPPIHHQPQQPDTMQARLSEAGAAELDPLHNGHPADLDTPAGHAVRADSASAGTWGLAEGSNCTQPAEAQPIHGADERPSSSVPSAGYTHRPEHVGSSSNAPDRHRANAPATGMGSTSGLGVKEEAASMGVGFQMGGDTDMADEEENVDVGAFVKPEKAMSRQGSGSSGSENGQAVLMDLDAQGRQPSPSPSPAPHAKPAQLDLVPRRKRSRSQDFMQEANDDSKRQKMASVPRPETGIEMPRNNLEAWTGQKCKVFWPDDAEWYDAVVRLYDRSSGKHNVWYPFDHQAEWLDLPAEVDAGRLCWTTYLPGHKPKEVIKPRPEPSQPPLPPPHHDPVSAIIQPAPPPPVASQQQQQQKHSVGPQIPQRRAAIGHRVAIWWEGDQIWYHGSIKGYTEEGCKHLIYYDDGEMEYLDLSRDRVFWKDLPGRVISPLGSTQPEDALATAEPLPTATAADGMLALAAAVDAAAAAAEPATPAVPKGPVPDTVPIVCNSSRAVFDVKRTMIMLGEGRECTPTEFERLAGKGASKKWKASLRVDKGGGVPGPTMGDWLVDAGLDNPKAPRPKAAPAMHAARRQQVARQRFGSQAPKPQGKQAHRDGCMCIICKQARRVGRAWGGMSGMAGAPKWQAPMLTAGRRGQPVPRFGKRAFLHALPHLVCGPLQHKVWKLPESKAWTAEEWLQAKGHKVDEAAPPPAPAPASSLPAVKHEGTTRRGTVIRPSSAANTPAAAIVERDIASSKPAAKPTGGKAVGERRGLTMKERLHKCQQTERQRITFGKSGIHGWGLIARTHMKQDSMVVEYRGDLLRPKTSEDRQKYYNRIGKDCYLFNVNDDVIIDATMTGAVGRFTNHCCAPSMYTKVVEAEGESRLVFFARTDIKPGQELTYDYRFKEEEGDDKVQCKCGAPNCRGTLN